MKKIFVLLLILLIPAAGMLAEGKPCVCGGSWDEFPENLSYEKMSADGVTKAYLLSAGNYCVKSENTDYTDGHILIESGIVNICLHDGKLQCKGIVVGRKNESSSNAILNLYNYGEGCVEVYEPEMDRVGLFGVMNNSVFNMYGGRVSGNIDNCVINRGTFNLFGGEITNNGAGVANGGTFAMHDGNVTANNGILNSKVFMMNGGSIVGNSSGVCNDEAIFMMNGGNILGKECYGVENHGEGTISISEGTIEGKAKAILGVIETECIQPGSYKTSGGFDETQVVIVAGEKTTFQWNEIIDGSYVDAGSTLTVTKNGNRFTIDGGDSRCEIQNITIDSRDENTSFGSGSYVFRNVVLSGEFKVISTDDCEYQIKLESSVNANTCKIELNAGYSIYEKHKEPIRFYKGNIKAEIFCSTKRLSMLADNGSFLSLENIGNSSGMAIETYRESKAIIQNKGFLEGGILIQDDQDSNVYFTNDGDCIGITAWAYDNSELEFINNAKVGLVATGAESGANVRFVNNGEITNTTPDPIRYDGNEWGDYAMMIDIDADSHLEFSGDGKIYPGIQMYDYSGLNGKIGPINGPSVVYDIRGFEPGSDRNENIRRIREIADCVDFNWRQVRKIEGAQWVVAVYRDIDTRENTCVVTLADSNGIVGDALPEVKSFLTLPDSLKRIEEEAFSESGAQMFVVPEGCIQIDSRAFADCAELVKITLPQSVSQIAEDAFDGCGDFVIEAPEGSFAIDYARQIGCKYVELK